ncbi:CapA family protein [Demequina salsinemoris]|uniref:CapA family protein n=1 Tax=Demequina salsinemoris TaxID=577470 RepID=UPI00078455E5|nr:CapA family protein [Demequina salsinemoris]
MAEGAGRRRARTAAVTAGAVTVLCAGAFLIGPMLTAGSGPHPASPTLGHESPPVGDASAEAAALLERGPDAEAAPSASLAPSPEPEPDPEPLTFTLVTAGDVLPHAPVNRSARTEDGYDYAPLMTAVEPFVAGADLAWCHMEVPVAPDQTQITTYPVFGAPAELVTGLAGIGWDGCSTASNHSVDKGYAGVVATIDAFEQAGLGYAGTARDADDAAIAQTYVVSDGETTATVAHLAFAYGTNGLPVELPGSVSLFDADAADASPIIDAAQAARDAGADIVVVSVHNGVEYRTSPTPAQEEVARQIAASGLVDLYVGHHAHVPQPIVKLPGGTQGDGMWVAYGLGNMLSNQSSHCCVAQTSNGVLLTASFTMQPTGEVDTRVEWTATTVDRSDSHTIQVLSGADGGLGTLSAAEVAHRHELVAGAVGDAAPERVEPAGSFASSSSAEPRGTGSPAFAEASPTATR